MAVTVTPNLTLISDADTASSQGTWLGNSGGADTESKVQGVGSYVWQAAKNARTACTFTPTANPDMSAADTHVYFWMQCAVFPFANVKTTGTGTPSGLTIRLTDGSGNYREWHVAGKDTWGGEWKCFVIDLANTDQLYAQSGTMNWNDIDVLTFYIDISSSGTIRIIDNTWNDVLYFGTGLTLTGTDFDLVDAAAIDESSSYRYGVLENIDGVIFCQGKLTIGSGATATTFNSTDEAIIFRDRVGGGKGIVSSTLYELKLTGSGNTSVVNGMVCKGAGTTDVTRPKISADNANVTIAGSSFIRAKTVSFVAGNDVQNSVFNNCGEITPATAVFLNNTVSNAVGRSLKLAATNNVSGCGFLNNQTAIHHDTGGGSGTPTHYDYDALTFSGNTYDIENSAATPNFYIDIDRLNGSNPSDAKINNSAGGTTTILEIGVQLTLTGLVDGSDIEILTAGTETERVNIQENSGTTYVYSYSYAAEDYIDVGVFKPGYTPFYVRNYLLGATNGGLPIAQDVDIYYLE